MLRILILLCLIPLPARAAEQPPAPAPYETFYDFASHYDAKTRTLTDQQFLQKMSGKKVVIADLRDKQSYDSGHIKGAVHLGTDITIEKLITLAPSKDTTILLYCNNSLGPSRRVSLTTLALPQIAFLGYKNVYRLQDARDNNVRERLPFESKN